MSSRRQSRSGENEKHADVQTEHNIVTCRVTCVAICELVMLFSQKGIDELRKFQERMEMCNPEGDFVLSDDFYEGALGSSGLGRLLS